MWIRGSSPSQQVVASGSLLLAAYSWSHARSASCGENVVQMLVERRWKRLENVSLKRLRIVGGRWPAEYALLFTDFCNSIEHKMLTFQVKNNNLCQGLPSQYSVDTGR